MAVTDSSARRNMAPILRPLRIDSGTLYIMPSASEDIGLNLNLRDDRVALSYYALLNIPEADNTAGVRDKLEAKPRRNLFNVMQIQDAAVHYNAYNTLSSDMRKSAAEKIAASLQNYLMNFETVLINNPEYDYSAAQTVSERAFWKWLKETGAIRWDYARDASGNIMYMGDSPVFKEPDDPDYSKVVKCFGKISAGNSVSNDFGMFNETYVNIPTSYGETVNFFVQAPDDNYRLNHVYAGTSSDRLEGRDAISNTAISFLEVNMPFFDHRGAIADDTSVRVTAVDDQPADTLWEGLGYEVSGLRNAYLTDRGIYRDSLPDSLDASVTVLNRTMAFETTVLRSRLDAVSMVKDFDTLSAFWYMSDPESAAAIRDYDSFAIDASLVYGADFEFNAVLLYYSVYDKDMDTELATNLFGILFLNGPEHVSFESGTGNSLAFTIPTLLKRKSSPGGFGTGYSFRVNVKTSQIYDNTDAFIQDATTASAMYGEDFNRVVNNLNRSVQILQRQGALVEACQKNFLTALGQYQDLANKVSRLQEMVNDLMNRKNRAIDTSLLNAYEAHIGLLDASSLTAADASFGTLYANSVAAGYMNINDFYVKRFLTVDPDGRFTSDNIVGHDTMSRHLWHEVPLAGIRQADEYDVDDADENGIEDKIESYIRHGIKIGIEECDTSCIRTDGQPGPYVIMKTADSSYSIIKESMSGDYYVDNGRYVPLIIRYLQKFADANDYNMGVVETLVGEIDKVLKMEGNAKSSRLDVMDTSFKAVDTSINDLIRRVQTLETPSNG